MTTRYYPIYTAGYTGSTPDDLLSYADTLHAKVVDVRIVPGSRVPHWRRSALMVLLGAGAYCWLPDFGNVNYHHGPTAPVALRNPTAGLASVLPLLAAQPVILLCACAYKERATCHRLVVADLLAQETGASVEHLPTRFSEWQPATVEPAPLDRIAAALATGEAWDGRC